MAGVLFGHICQAGHFLSCFFPLVLGILSWFYSCFEDNIEYDTVLLFSYYSHWEMQFYVYKIGELSLESCEAFSNGYSTRASHQISFGSTTF